jgi:hypothetical protein
MGIRSEEFSNAIGRIGSITLGSGVGAALGAGAGAYTVLASSAHFNHPIAHAVVGGLAAAGAGMGALTGHSVSEDADFPDAAGAVGKGAKAVGNAVGDTVEGIHHALGSQWDRKVAAPRKAKKQAAKKAAEEVLRDHRNYEASKRYGDSHHVVFRLKHEAKYGLPSFDNH